MKTRILALVACLAATLTFIPSIHADAVTDWNAALETIVQIPSERPPRLVTIMHVAMFDAVNGIERKYEPCHVTDPAPPGARAEAAAIQAAYTVLSTMRPAYQAAFDAQLQASLATLAGHQGDSESIARGRAWGEEVALKIIAWRANDGSSTVLPAFVGSTAAGFWRHTPLGTAPTAGYVNLVTVPFVLPNQATFDPGPPYGFLNRADALKSALYAIDVNEVKARGGVTSAVRSADELADALFIHACELGSLNRLLRSLVSPNDKLVENARRFALLNITWHDAMVMLFRAKYTYALWRPFQAINFANEGLNPAITQDASWKSYLPTPSHPEYPSAHVTLFTSGCTTIIHMVGDSREVQLTAPTFAPRTYASVSAIPLASVEARINIGFHFRETTEASLIMGRAIADYVVDHTLRPLR